MNPNQYALYKGTGGKYGALQLNFQPPHFFCGKTKDFQGKIDANKEDERAAFTVVEGKIRLKEGWKSRDGCIFLEATCAIGKNKYDWRQSIKMALSPGDIGKILYFLQTGQSPVKKERAWEGKLTRAMSLMHDPNARSAREGEVRKYLRFYSPNGPADGLMLTVEQISEGEKRSHQIPVSGDEVMVLRLLLAAAIPSALNW